MHRRFQRRVQRWRRWEPNPNPSPNSRPSPNPYPNQVSWKAKLKQAFPNPNDYSEFMGAFSACTGTVENVLRGVSGVEEATVVLLPKGSAEVAFDPDVTGPRELIEAIEDAGFDALVSSSERVGAGAPQKAAEAEASRFRSLFWTSLAYTAPVFAINMILPGIPGFAWLYRDAMNHVSMASFAKWALATPVQFHVGRRFHVGAYRSLMNGSANMDVLVSMATNVAYFTSIYLIAHCIVTGHSYGKDFFETSTMLVTFILLGKYLESIAKGQTSEAIGKLLDLTPNTATLLERKPETKDAQEDTAADYSDYAERSISSTLIHRGDLLKVYPGSRIAADGALVARVSLGRRSRQRRP